MKKKNIVSLIIIILSFLGLLLFVFAKTMDIARSLANTNMYLEYLYYGLILIATYFFLIRPFLIVMFSPSFSLQIISKKLEGEQKRKVVVENYLNLRKYGKRLVNKNLINEEEKELIINELNSKEKDLVIKYNNLRTLLVKITNTSIKKDIRKIVITTARDTLYLSSISQSSFIDVLIVVVNNFRLLKRIVARCGFRPSFIRLLKFYINVSISSLIADGAQKLDFNSMLGNTVKGLSRPIVGSLLDGLVNSFFMLRTGFLAKNYIFEEYKDEKEKSSVRNSAFMEAAAALPELTLESIIKPISDVLVDGVIHPTKKVVQKLFSKENELILEEN